MTIAYLVSLIVLLPAAVERTRNAARRPRVGPVGIAVSMWALAAAFTVRGLNFRSPQLPNLAFLLWHYGIIVAVTAMMVATLYVSQEGRLTRRGITARVFAGGAAIVCYTRLFALVPKNPLGYDLPRQVGTPKIVVAPDLLYVAFVVYCMVEIAIACNRTRRKAPRRSTRTGMLLVVVGCLIAIAAGVAAFVENAGLLLNSFVPATPSIILDPIAAMLIAVGVLSSPISLTIQQRRHGQSAALDALWRQLIDRLPEISLSSAPGVPVGLRRGILPGVRQRVEVTDALSRIAVTKANWERQIAASGPAGINAEVGRLLADPAAWRLAGEHTPRTLADLFVVSGADADADAIAAAFHPASTNTQGHHAHP